DLYNLFIRSEGELCSLYSLSTRCLEGLSYISSVVTCASTFVDKRFRTSSFATTVILSWVYPFSLNRSTACTASSAFEYIPSTLFSMINFLSFYDVFLTSKKV